MMRGTFANIRIKNEMVPGVEGGMTKLQPGYIADADLRRGDGIQKSAACRWSFSAARNTAPARRKDWAAKGTLLLGVKAVITESFERIHRSNLVGMGVLPLTFKEGTSRQSLGLTGMETLDTTGVKGRIKPHGRDLDDPRRWRGAIRN